MINFIIALTSVAFYEYKRTDLRKFSKRLRRKYEDWLDT